MAISTTLEILIVYDSILSGKMKQDEISPFGLLILQPW
jgi:hypothetical protein